MPHLPVLQQASPVPLGSRSRFTPLQCKREHFFMVDPFAGPVPAAPVDTRRKCSTLALVLPRASSVVTPLSSSLDTSFGSCPPQNKHCSQISEAEDVITLPVVTLPVVTLERPSIAEALQEFLVQMHFYPPSNEFSAFQRPLERSQCGLESHTPEHAQDKLGSSQNGCGCTVFVRKQPTATEVIYVLPKQHIFPLACCSAGLSEFHLIFTILILFVPKRRIVL